MYRRSWMICLGLLLAASLALQFGCTKALVTAAYLIKGTNDPAEFDELKDKRVAVVCRSQTDLGFEAAGVDKQLALAVGELLRTRGRHIKVIDQREVDNWIDENAWEDFSDIGRALEDCDMVVGIDLLSFSLYQGQTLYQGNAEVKLIVCDMSHGGKPAWEKSMNAVVYPLNHGRPAQDEPPAQFRRKYVDVLAKEISQHFYPHDHFSKNREALYDD
ncbi:MAG TPA: hypothetical protein VF306_12355 [Pirellulales bacterium]